jgi:hypothetical protein
MRDRKAWREGETSPLPFLIPFPCGEGGWPKASRVGALPEIRHRDRRLLRLPPP